jgi:hypothetical protein
MKSLRSFGLERDMVDEGLRSKIHMPRLNCGVLLSPKVSVGFTRMVEEMIEISYSWGTCQDCPPPHFTVGLLSAGFTPKARRMVMLLLSGYSDIYFLPTFTCCNLISHSTWVAQGSA